MENNEHQNQPTKQAVKSPLKAQIPAFTIGQPKNSGPRNSVNYPGFDNAYQKTLN